MIAELPETELLLWPLQWAVMNPGDLRSKPIILIKGLLFLLIIALCAAFLLLQSPALSTLVALAVLVWASARFYYFLFYVLHAYVDPSLKYAGLTALIGQLRRRQGPPRP